MSVIILCFFNFICMDILHACVSVCHMSAVPVDTKENLRFCGTEITDGYEQSCVLGIKPESFGRAASIPNQ